MNKYQNNHETVISGSFRKHMEEIGKAMAGFENAGVKVRAPGTPEAIDPNQEFIILTSDDPDKPAHKLEMDFMREIGKATFLYVADVNGYIGKSAATEMAYARLKNTPILTAEAVDSFNPEVSEEVQEILKSSIIGMLPIEDISSEKIEQLKGSLEQNSLSDLDEDQAKVLNDLIKELLKELTYPNEEK